MIKNIISAFFARGLVAAINLAVLLISSRQLGAANIGQITVLILNITIIQIVNEIYTGYSLVHFLAKFSIRTVYLKGILWTLACIAVLNPVFFACHIGPQELWLHTAALSLMGTLGSFHSVVILAKQKVAAYNFLVFFQPAVLLLGLCINVFLLRDTSTSGYISAMYVSFLLTLIVSGVVVIRLISADQNTATAPYSFRAIVSNGVINQAGNLAHTLSNRLNVYLIGANVLIGIFSRASSLIESVWLISAGITPLVLTRVANQKDDAVNGRITFLLSKISFLLSCLAVLVIVCLPERLFTFLLGPDFAGVKQLMLYLSPGIVFIAFSTVISHYFSGTGEQRVQLISNTLGLLVTIISAPLLIARYQLTGACIAASLSYFMQALSLTVIFMRKRAFGPGSIFNIRTDLKLLRK